MKKISLFWVMVIFSTMIFAASCAWASEDTEAGERMVKTVNGVEYAFRWCPAGKFMMGSPEDELGWWHDEKQHSVTLSQGFWMLETEVTQQMWKSVMGENPCKNQGLKLPVSGVNWERSQEFCQKLRALGLNVQLPTEAQWEYACRAGTTSALNSGKKATSSEGICNNVGEVGWYNKNSGRTTHTVGQKKPNSWGLYDMHGNVFEWCSDYWESDLSNSVVTDPEQKRPGTGDRGSYHICRGGGCNHGAGYCRSAARGRGMYKYGGSDVGLRICMVPGVDVTSTEVKAPEGREAGQQLVKTVNGVKYIFRWCPTGLFMMGSSITEKERNTDEKQHSVTFSQGFWMLETEVTQEMWKSVMGNNPSNFTSDIFPVEKVSWYDCQTFCGKLRALGLNVQLPTEAQWEYACRAGTTEAYARDLDIMAWYSNNSSWTTHAVGQKKPNAWGLYDMHGNVWEWCADWYGEDYPPSGVMDPNGPESGSERVSRGGGWDNLAKLCRSANRVHHTAEMRSASLGFRICMVPEKDAVATEAKLPDVQKKKVKKLEGREAGERMVRTVNGVEYAFRWCPAGSFIMGSLEDELVRGFGEKPHPVTLSQGFWMLETEVTQQMWKSVMGEHRRHFKGENLPMESVSWNECQVFCQKLCALGLNVQLPTEAQWEYACRAGTTGAYAGDVDAMGWYDENSEQTTHAVGQKKPNAWGLYDMHGNVCEWCADYWKNDLGSGGVMDSKQPTRHEPAVFATYRVHRGGSWCYNVGGSRSACRYKTSPRDWSYLLGFRICMVPKKDAVTTEAKLPDVQKKEVNTSEGREAGERMVRTVNGVEYAFRWCPAGKFMMGSPEGELGRDSDETQHSVTLWQGFWMLETEVTQEMWESVMGESIQQKAKQGSYSHDLRGEGRHYPMYYVGWNDCQIFCQKLRALGLNVQLPTEAQWEYACRAGTTEALNNGKNLMCEIDTCGNLGEVGWYDKNSDATTHIVGQKKPNAWGLYDMHGNVWEWCSDYWERDLGREAVTDPEGADNGLNRVYRGGSWGNFARDCRSAIRDNRSPVSQYFLLGFRVFLMPDK